MYSVYKYCEDINSNINWHDMLYDYKDVIYQMDKYGVNTVITTKLTKLIERIKNLAWVDKPPGEQHDDRNKHIENIVRMFMSNDYSNKHIGILLTKTNDTEASLSSNAATNDTSLPYIRYKHYKQLANKMVLIGQIMRLDCVIVDNIDELNKCDAIIPLTSFLLSKEDVNKIDVSKLMFPTIHDHNIIINDGSPNKTQCFDFIQLLHNYINYDDCNKYVYNYVFVG